MMLKVWAVVNPKGVGLDAIVAIIPESALPVMTELAMLHQSGASDRQSLPDKWVMVPFTWQSLPPKTANEPAAPAANPAGGNEHA